MISLLEIAYERLEDLQSAAFLDSTDFEDLMNPQGDIESMEADLEDSEGAGRGK